MGLFGNMKLPTSVLALSFLWTCYASQVVFNVDKTFEDDILEAARVADSCTSCRSLLLPLKRLALSGDERFINTFTSLCKLNRLQDPDVCEGDIARHGPIIAHDLRNIDTGSTTARRLCDALYSTCPPVPTTPYDISFPERHLPSIRPPTSTNKSSRTPKHFQVVHLSDIHLDQEYTIGSEGNCTKYICCRNFDDDRNGGRPVKAPALPFGHRHCDSPTALVESLLEAIETHVPQATFTFSTGDIVDHANWLMTQSSVESRLHGFHELLYQGLASSNPFYGALGNHDTMPTNSFPPITSEYSNKTDWLFSMLSVDWERWIGEQSSSKSMHISGSYSVVHPGTNLKLISLNTQYWYKHNFWLYESDEFRPDPNGIQEFLVQELHLAEALGQRAWIFGHIPPGASDALYDQTNYYDQIIRRYEKTIAAQFFGHTHRDQFEVGYRDYEWRSAANAMSFGLIAPALTPTEGNPAFTVYDVDADTYDILDVKVYFANMSDPWYHVKPRWKLLYSARDTYLPLVLPRMAAATNVTNAIDVAVMAESMPLDAKFWHHLTEVFERNSTAFELYRNLGGRLRDPPYKLCKGRCKEQALCAIRSMRAESNCDRKNLKDIVARRHEAGEGDFAGAWDEASGAGECEGTSFPLIVQGLLQSVSREELSIDSISRREERDAHRIDLD